MRRHKPRKPTPYKPFETDESAAYIYLLTNSAFPYVKIGFTEKSPKERAKELTTATGVPGEFKVADDWFVPKDQVRGIESEIHSKLKRDGKHHRKEFFNVSVQDAKRAIVEVLQTKGLYELAITKESERLTKLKSYYENKRKSQIEMQNAIERRDRAASLKKKSQLMAYYFDYMHKHNIYKKHPVQCLYLPNTIGSISLIIGVSITFWSNKFLTQQWMIYIGISIIAAVVFRAYIKERVQKDLDDKYHAERVAKIENVINDIESGKLDPELFMKEKLYNRYL